MVEVLIWFFASAVFVDFIGYWLHRWAHRPSSPLYKPHMTHHTINYPPRAYFSEIYKSSHSDGLALWFAPFGVVYVTLIFLLNFPHPYSMLAGGLLVAVLSSIFHELSHVTKSVLWTKSLLKGVAVRHYTHHFKMGRNFGIITGLWDVIFRTRRLQVSSSPKNNRRHGR